MKVSTTRTGQVAMAGQVVFGSRSFYSSHPATIRVVPTIERRWHGTTSRSSWPRRRMTTTTASATTAQSQPQPQPQLQSQSQSGSGSGSSSPSTPQLNSNSDFDSNSSQNPSVDKTEGTRIRNNARERLFFEEEPTSLRMRTSTIPGPNGRRAMDELARVFDVRSLTLVADYGASLGN